MALVCVWLPHKADGAIDVGHSSLLLDKIRPPAYVSWWPTDGVNKARPSTKGHANPPYRRDVESEHGNPNYFVSLKCLEENRIAHWWNQVKAHGVGIPLASRFQPVSNDYDLWDNNCSTIVLLAMRVGGSERVAPFQGGIVTPINILFYARTLQLLGG